MDGKTEWSVSNILLHIKMRFVDWLSGILAPFPFSAFRPWNLRATAYWSLYSRAKENGKDNGNGGRQDACHTMGRMPGINGMV
jgi:hypothetical protein